MSINTKENIHVNQFLAAYDLKAKISELSYNDREEYNYREKKKNIVIRSIQESPNLMSYVTDYLSFVFDRYTNSKDWYKKPIRIYIKHDCYKHKPLQKLYQQLAFDKKNNTVNATQIPETQSYFRAATITERIADNLNEVAQHYSDVNIARQIW